MQGWLRALLSAAALGATAAVGQAQSTKGVFLGLQYAGSSLNVKDAAEDLEFGNGYGLHAGIGLSENWSVLANFDRSVLTGARSNRDVTISQYDALVRLNLVGAASPVKLFVTAGATARSVNQGRDFEDISPTGGGGVQLFLTPKIAVHGTALWTFGKLTQLSQLTGNAVPGQYNSTATRVQAGASLYLFGR